MIRWIHGNPLDGSSLDFPLLCRAMFPDNYIYLWYMYISIYIQSILCISTTLLLDIIIIYEWRMLHVICTLVVTFFLDLSCSSCFQKTTRPGVRSHLRRRSHRTCRDEMDPSCCRDTTTVSLICGIDMVHVHPKNL